MAPHMFPVRSARLLPQAGALVRCHVSEGSGGRAGQIPGESGFRAAGISGSQRAQASPPPSCRRPQGLPSACLSPKDLLVGRLIISLGLAIESQSRHQAGRRRWMVPYKNERQSQTVQASF